MIGLHGDDWHSRTSAEVEWGQRLEVCMSEGVIQVRYGGTVGGLYNMNTIITMSQQLAGSVRVCAMFYDYYILRSKDIEV